MKKRIALWISLILLLTVALSGCGKGGKTVEAGASLSVNPVASEQIYKMDGADTLALTFDLPAAGFIKLMAYDATEYEDYMEEYPEGTLAFYDEEGKELYKDIAVSNGYIEKCRFEAGKVVAKIVFSGKTAEMDQVAVAWAYAADSDTPSELKAEGRAAAAADEEGNAQFSVEIEKAGIYTVTPAEGCLLESDCGFAVTDSQGKLITGNISIHGTEWASRKVFLPKGDYIITVNNVNAVATCGLSAQETFETVILQGEAGAALPAALGFTAERLGPVETAFTADGTQTTLTASATGTNSYYDYEQGFNLSVKDASGKTVIEEECEGSGSWDIADLKGDYTVSVTSQDNAAVKLTIE